MFDEDHLWPVGHSGVRANFSSSDLSGLHLDGFDLRYAIFHRSILTGAQRQLALTCDINRAVLDGADLSHSRLDGADLIYSNVRATCLTRAI